MMSSSNPPSAADTYYLGLDGLRAVAVLLVLLFHAQLSFVPGGSIGVDVFFCISGYIITTQIYRLIESERFRLDSFWARRIARLVPAVPATIAVTIVACWFVLPNSALQRLYDVSVYSALSISNFYFLAESGYFDAESKFKPLLHTWSLGVEFQFYLVWPLILMAAYRVGGRSAAVVAVVVLGIASLLASFYVFPESPSDVFFMMPFRIYQFSLGAIVALLALEVRGAGGTLLLCAGLVGLVLNAVFVDTASAGLIEMHILPVVFSIMILLAIRSNLAGLVLGNRAMVSIGQASYSIYLVHWPLMVLYFYSVSVDVSLAAALALIAFSFVLGYALHYLVEKPFRFNKFTPPGRRATTLKAVTGSLVALIGFAKLAGANQIEVWPDRGRPQATTQAAFPKKRELAAEVRERARYGVCAFAAARSKRFNVSGFKPETCLKVEKGKSNILVIGNSITDSIYVGLVETLDPEKFAISQASYAGCNPGQSPDRIRFEECRNFDETRRQLALDGAHEIVILVSQWINFGATDGLAEFIEELKKRNKKVLIVSGNPYFNRSALEVAEQNFQQGKIDVDMFAYLDHKRASSGAPGKPPVDADIRAVAQQTGAGYFDAFPHLCSDKSCPGRTPEGHLIYYDNRHLTVEGSKFLARALVPVIERMLKNEPGR